jgi:peptidoglycan/LPS O-acetylase OafA/YrhL
MTPPAETVSRSLRADPAPAPLGAGRFPLSVHEKIDICRGLFAALVVMAHSLEIAWGVHPGAAEALPGWVHDVVFGVFGTGTYYVLGFFVLSGYCVHRSVARSMEEERFPTRRYCVARLTRIMPLYYLGLLTTVAAEWAIAGARPEEWPNGLNLATFVAQVFMVQNLTQTFGSYASSWSMTNEVFYYLLYGLLAACLAGRRGRPARVGMGACLAVAVVTQVLYVTVARNRYVYSAGMLMGLGMLWFAGALVAVYDNELGKVAWVRLAARAWPAVLAVAIGWKTAHLPPHGLYLISGLAFTLMLLSFLAGSPMKTPDGVGPWRAGAVTTLGLSSYPMYLFHGPLLMLLGSWVVRSGAVSDWRATWALLVAAGLSSGLALGWLLERPVMRWRAALLRRWSEPGSRGAPGRPAAGLRPATLGAGARSWGDGDRRSQR